MNRLEQEAGERAENDFSVSSAIAWSSTSRSESMNAGLQPERAERTEMSSGKPSLFAVFSG